MTRSVHYPFVFTNHPSTLVYIHCAFLQDMRDWCIYIFWITRSSCWRLQRSCNQNLGMRRVLFHQAAQQRERTIDQNRGSWFRRAGYPRLWASVYRCVDEFGAGLVTVTHATHYRPQNTSTSATRAPWLMLRSPIHNSSGLIWLTAPYILYDFFSVALERTQTG